ncbi:MAG TPA: 2Fe-2S ferredoxin [Legionella sp.]|nr:2Fe-2S ferredoxin [Legionella sp.]
MSYYTKHIFVCTNQKADGKACCANAGGEPFFDYLKERLHALGLYGHHKIRVSKSGCLGRCGLGPCMVIYPEGVWYTYGTPSDIDEIIRQHLVSGQSVERLLINSD